MSAPLRLLFISPRFLFPLDNGGAIRTTQILRGMQGGAFHVRLLSPFDDAQRRRFADDIESVCDEFRGWPGSALTPLRRLARLHKLASALPIPIADDATRPARAAVAAALAERPDLVVFDFLHAAALAPRRLDVRSLLFTHNVESEIFSRHRALARNPLMSALWRNQERKMIAFEGAALRRFDAAVAVSERDKTQFRSRFGADQVATIPTVVDLDRFLYQAPADTAEIVFIGSMDSMANIDGVEYFMTEVWPRIAARRPDASLRVVGRNPPASLVAKARALNWTFTGTVDEVSDHVRAGALCVIPLRAGGGTRIKAYEGMALGLPTVATGLGMEGLDVKEGEHYLRADQADPFADAVLTLLNDKTQRDALARRARGYVERHFGAAVAAERFESICLDVVNGRSLASV